MVGIAPTTVGANTTTDQLNLVNPKNGYIGSYNIVVSPVLTQVLGAGKAWFLLNKAKLDLLQKYKRRFRLEKGVDNRTGNKLYRGTMRYGISAFDWRGAWGANA